MSGKNGSTVLNDTSRARALTPSRRKASCGEMRISNGAPRKRFLTGPVGKFSNGAGFTFIEVIAALAIVSISLLGLLRFHLLSIRMVNTARMTSQAVFLAQDKIAETLAGGYPELGTNSGSVERDNSSLKWRTEVTDLHLPQWLRADINGLRKISVDVAFKQGVHRKHLQMSTCVADRKLE